MLYLSNFKDSSDQFVIPYSKFYNFTATITTVSVSIGFSKTSSLSGIVCPFKNSQSQQFNAIQHQFTQVNANLLNLYVTPPSYVNTGQDMPLNG